MVHAALEMSAPPELANLTPALRQIRHDTRGLRREMLAGVTFRENWPTSLPFLSRVNVRNRAPTEGETTMVGRANCVIALRSEGVSLVLDISAGQLPAIVHWGADLGTLEPPTLRR